MSDLLEARQERARAEWKDRCAKVRVGRSIPEWRGKKADSKVPDAVRDRVLETWGGACYLSGIIIAGKPWDLEHVIPLAEGGENREANLRPALRAPHIIKSAKEKKRQSKADRARRAGNGTKAAPKQKLEGAGFAKAEPQARATKEVEKLAGLPRRPMYRDV